MPPSNIPPTAATSQGRPRVVSVRLPGANSHFSRVTEGASAFVKGRPGWALDTTLSAKFFDRVDGRIEACCRPSKPPYGDSVPTVNVSNVLKDPGLPTVVSDDVAAGRVAADYFLRQKHEAFAIFAPSDNAYTHLRAEGYRAALRERGHDVVSVGEPGLLDSMRPEEADKNIGHIRSRLAALPRPCAIFAVDDLRCAILCRIALEAGHRVPEDFALLGVDDNRFVCENGPVALSSVALGSREIGWHAAEWLCKRIEGEALPGGSCPRLLIPPGSVVERASTDLLTLRDSIVARARAIIEGEFTDPLRIDEIAARIGVSRRYLEMRFKAALGESPQRVLLRRRLGKARELLTGTDQSITAIAYACGFSDYKHMAQHLQKEWGQTAREIRATGQRPPQGPVEGQARLKKGARARGSATAGVRG